MCPLCTQCCGISRTKAGVSGARSMNPTPEEAPVKFITQTALRRKEIETGRATDSRALTGKVPCSGAGGFSRPGPPGTAPVPAPPPSGLV